MIFIAAACVVVTTTVVVGVAVTTRVHELIAPACAENAREKGTADAAPDDSAGCTAHLYQHLYQQA